MSIKLANNRIFLTAIMLVASPEAFAQTSINDIEGAITQGSQFDEARALSEKRDQQAGVVETIDGEAGVFILKKSKNFVVGASAGGGYSSNPGRTLDTSRESGFANFALRAGINTVVAQSYNVGVNIVGSATEYEDSLGPSNRSGVANISIGRTFWDDRLSLSGSAVAGVNTNKKLKQASTFYGISLNASYLQRLSGRVFLRPSISASRQWSGNSEQNNISLTGSTELIWQPTPKWVVSGRLAYTHRKYDNFFEDVTFVKRKDNQIQAGLRVSRQISDRLSLSVSYDYTSQNSSFFLSRYDAHDGGLSLQINQRF